MRSALRPTSPTPARQRNRDPEPSLAVLADPDRDEGVLGLTWLVRLRWVALLGQVLTLSFTFSVLDGSWVLLPLSGVMLVLVLGNLEATHALRRGAEVTQARLLAHLALEVSALTFFLAASGGVENPFAVLYLVHVCMGAVMLTWGKAAVLTTLVVACYVTLSWVYLPLRLEHHSLPPDLLLRLGTTFAFVISAGSAAGFTVGVARTLRGHKRALLDARDRTARVDRLRTVGTLAAGAAHELNTPLFTMDLRLRRIQRRHTDDEDTRKDTEVIKAQLDRCKEIVQQLLAGAGDPSASGLERRPLSELVRNGVGLWSKGTTLSVELTDRADDLAVEVPPVAFRQALSNLLENAREAQLEAGVDRPLHVTIERDGDFGVVRVRDHGVGLPTQNERIGDPFFTTKVTGTGLGVYVARAVADGAGGGLRYTSERGSFTEAIWWFPIAQGPTRTERNA
jgi:two-component system sensor histidine kinase RegB